MKINISELRKGVGEFRKLKEEFLLDMDLPGETKQRVFFDGIISNVGKTFLLRGKARASFTLSCARCLRSFSLDESVPIEEEFTEHPKAISSEMQWNKNEVNFFAGY